MHDREKTAVIFDLDGTLLDTLTDLTAAVNYILGKYGYPLRSRLEVRSFIGNGIAKLLERSIPERVEEAELARIVSEYKDYYREHLLEGTFPYRGIVQLLMRFRDEGIPMAVVTNKFQAGAQALVDARLPGLLDVTIGESSAFPTKPAPDAVYEAMRRLGVDRAIYVGDSHVDVRTARNAGLELVAVDWGFEDRRGLIEAGADAIASTAEELEMMIRQKGV